MTTDLSIIHHASVPSTDHDQYYQYLHERGIYAEGLHPVMIEGELATQIGIQKLIPPIDGKAWIARRSLEKKHKLPDSFFGLTIRPFPGMMVRYQECLDRPKMKRLRFRWFGADLSYRKVEPDPSAGVTGSDLIGAPRWELPAKTEVVPFLGCLLPEWYDDVSVPILVVEGPIKAIALAQYGFAVVGKAGAEAGLHAPAKKGMTEKVLALHTEANRIRWGGRTVYLMMDSGQRRNPAVARGVARDAKLLREAGANVKVVYIPSRPPKRSEDQADPKSYDWGPEDLLARVLRRTLNRLVGVANAKARDDEHWLHLLDLAVKIAVKTAKATLVNLLLDAKPANPLDRVHECANDDERDDLLEDLPFKASLDFLTKVQLEQVMKAFGPSKRREIKAAKDDFTAAVKAKLDTADRVGSPAEVLAEILDGFTFVRSPVGRMYAKVGLALMPTDSSQFLAKVAKEYRAKSGSFAAQDTIRNALLAYSGDDLPEVEVPIRFERCDGKIYLDLGTKEGVVEISSEECRVLTTDAPVSFYRSKISKGLPVPVFSENMAQAKESLERFRELLGLKDKDEWWSCLGWLLSAMGTTGTYSILIARGEKGSGKSMRSKLLRRLIDPQRPEISGLPKTEQDIAILAQNGFILAFDNLRFLNRDLSDALCRMATGDGLITRTLYSDLDLTAMEAARPIILNGISDVAKEPDILDRSLVATFARFEDKKEEKIINADFDEMHAEVLGALCFLCSEALRFPFDGENPQDIRMVGPARFGAAAACSLAREGEPNPVWEAYESAQSSALDIAADDAFVSTLLGMMEKKGTWTGKASQLANEMEQFYRGDDVKKKLPDWFPRTGAKISSELARFSGELRDLGLMVASEKKGGGAKRGTYYTLVLEGHDSDEVDAVDSSVDPYADHEPDEMDDILGNV